MKKKKLTKINFITELYHEWSGQETITVEENLYELLSNIRTNQRNGTTIMPIKAIDSPIKAININYITQIWVEEVEE